ncbi:DUF881 domain-containing protein [Jeotgalibacillus sp. S-D1]|uniref:DUF881 domain-containing protein n=1 Tax=Jeotgalibacillus sp. S-D1 TaxID=2552189 RepID=UPI001059ABA5|nr:DUF881 domain-containing protein [Jeotgalibacillus sp. S-D1]TDL35119.1 DUF881 domain-containing protein [Jeotgalibacillus sp. S-D1]
MNRKAKRNFTLITIAVGFLVAVQFKMVQQPVVRDNRDIWELKQETLAQLQMQSSLLSQIQNQENTIFHYEDDKASAAEKALEETVYALGEEAGMAEIEASGLIIELKPVEERLMMGASPATITPELLRRLVNQLYQFNAKYISINEERLIATSVIRDINGETTVNSKPVPNLPITVKVAVENFEDAEKLYNKMQGSVLIEDFFIEDIRLTVNDPERTLIIPAYEKMIQVRSMKPVSTNEGE